MVDGQPASVEPLDVPVPGDTSMSPSLRHHFGGQAERRAQAFVAVAVTGVLPADAVVRHDVIERVLTSDLWRSGSTGA